jgi:endonuclease/exonuclease/phosphatase (EEP) superfamily protein YafD
MTYNVGNGLAKPEQLIPLLRSSGADLIGLQELSIVQAQAINRDLRSLYPHQALFPGGFEGQGVISHYPICSVEQLHLYPSRPDLNCVVQIDGVSLGVVVAHPPPPRFRFLGVQFDSQARTQITTLISKAVARPPSVLLGDLNTYEGTDTYAELLAAGLKDAFRSAGNGAGHTLPVRLGLWKRLQRINRMIRWIPMLPFIRVDYIWYTDPLTPIAAWVGADAGSDHLPVLARLVIDVNQGGIGA